jgi:hypothetical protein
VIHIMTHDPRYEAQGTGRCETAPPAPRALAVPLHVMHCVCVFYFAARWLAGWLALLLADFLATNARFMHEDE